MSDWQPIETAPRGLVELLLFDTAGVIRVAILAFAMTRKHKPTHWMPLPSPPVSA